MTMTRRWFTQLVIGFAIALPIRAEYRVIEQAPAQQEKAGPLSPLRRYWEPMDMDKFRIGLQKDLFDRGIAFE